MVFGTLGQPVGIGCLRSQREKMALLQSSIALSGFPSSSSSSSSSQLQGRFKLHAFNHKAKAFKTRRVSPRAALLELKPPPYAFDALEPLMSKRTFEFHWGKHHRAYVDNCNNQIKGTELESLSLPDIVTRSYNHGDPLPVFNNAAQAWNHEFFWESMKPGGGKEPSGKVLEKITSDFGSYEEFVKQFKQAAATQFGSGWAWLVLKDQKLAIEKTPNAVNPLVFGHTPLLTIDVWEHAYYLDYQNRRPDYITTFVNELISWDSVTARLDAA